MRLDGCFCNVALTCDGERYRIHTIDDDANLLVDATEPVILHMVDHGDLYEIPNGEPK